MLKGSVLLDDTKGKMMMMMMILMMMKMISQRRDGQLVNPPSLQVVMCTKLTKKKNR